MRLLNMSMRHTAAIGSALVLLLNAAGCKPDNRMGAMNYMKFFQNPEGDAVKMVETAMRTYRFSMQPHELVALRDAWKFAEPLRDSIYKKRLQETGGTFHLVVQIINKESTRSVIQADALGLDDVEMRTHYYQFEAGSDLFCLCGTDTLHPLDYAFEDGYDLVNHSTMSAVFRACPEGNVTAVFNDRPANQQYLQVEFDQQAFPTLK